MYNNNDTYCIGCMYCVYGRMDARTYCTQLWWRKNARRNYIFPASSKKILGNRVVAGSQTMLTTAVRAETTQSVAQPSF